jgi:hypothetical protein
LTLARTTPHSHSREQVVITRPGPDRDHDTLIAKPGYLMIAKPGNGRDHLKGNPDRRKPGNRSWSLHRHLQIRKARNMGESNCPDFHVARRLHR